jgi:ketosteroid isomerase-like protein
LSISAIDKLLIQEVMIRMYRALDAHDAKGYASYFAPDGISVSPRGVFRGRSAIANFIEHHLQQGNENGTLHCLSNMIIYGNGGDEVSIRLEVMKFQVNTTSPTISVSAFGTARMRKFETWQIMQYNLGHRV